MVDFNLFANSLGWSVRWPEPVGKKKLEKQIKEKGGGVVGLLKPTRSLRLIFAKYGLIGLSLGSLPSPHTR